ncbi:MAG TPA: hypothetical protein PKJ08_01445 [Candidatus Cloacimonadota bacterium]|nr:hypothetical protein [Candidatus Cloacimonadota bacterium]
MKNCSFIILIVLTTFLLVACDSRNNDKPTMMVSISKSKIYYPHFSEINGVSYHEANIVVTLDGTDSQTKNALIELTYDESVIGVISNTGNEKLLRTDDSGIATGQIISRNPGTANINVKIKNWNVSAITGISVSLPEIINFEANPDTINADNTQISQLTLSMMPPLSSKYIKYTASIGELVSDSTSTNNLGNTSNQFKSAFPGNAYITAKLKDWPSQSATRFVKVVNTNDGKGK